MAQVGIVRYDADADTYTGEFRSLSLSAPIVFKPNPDKDVKGKRPAYRIYARGDVEIGGAWRNTNKEVGEIKLIDFESRRRRRERPRLKPGCSRASLAT